MAFTRGQTQVIYQFLPGAVFEHDQYGFCKISGVELQEKQVNQDAIFNAVSDLLFQWPDETFRGGFPDPRLQHNRRRYVIGTPAMVRFVPFPTVLECRRCRRVYRLRDLARRANAQPRQCPSCSGILGQLRYVQAHNCGRVEELYYPQNACPRHGSRALMFLDTGRVRSARWRCGDCGNAEVGRLRMTPCTCQYSRSLGNQQATIYERGLKTLPLTDSALFLPHVVPFINFNEEEERVFSQDPETLSLVLARTWGILSSKVPETIRERASRLEANVENDDTSEDLARELEKVQPNHPLVLQWKGKKAARAVPPGHLAINRVRELLGAEAPSANARTPRQFIEHAAILDTLHTISVEEAAKDLTSIGDAPGARSLQSAREFALRELGISELRIVSDFPIALCAVGYTRITRDPNRSILTPFETLDSNGRVPLYIVSSETEGIYFQLDPIRTVTWLIENRWIQTPLPDSKEAAWSWLYRHVPGLYQSRWQPNYNDHLAVAIRTLIHTMSHVLLRHVEWSGFSQNSVGEYLIPAALSGILYANRYAETKIGGLTTLFEHQLGIWLDDSSQSGRQCVYDPFCTDEGGTCVGCLHREHNCPQFNRELSRAVLYGGPTPPPELGGGLGVPAIDRLIEVSGSFSDQHPSMPKKVTTILHPALPALVSKHAHLVFRMHHQLISSV